MHIANILTPEECAAICDILARDELWRDGGDTAKGAARSVKYNLQADRTDNAVIGIKRKIEKALSANAVFYAAASPCQFARLLISKYVGGMSYGDHVDAPYIDGVRTDISFTLFLNAPEAYEGGELVIDSSGHEDAVKGAAGSVVLYASDAVHRVAEVRSGDRIVCVGWLKSRVKAAADRRVLFELERILADLRAVNTDASVLTRLTNVRNSLLRRFGE